MAGLFWHAVPQDEWPDDAEAVHSIQSSFIGPFGDCRQELVFIGQKLDQAQMLKQLEQCLLTEQELALSINEWKAIASPFQAEFA